MTNNNENQQGEPNANTGNEQNSSNAQYIPTFGVGGQNSHVVDPEFRQPEPSPSVPALLFDPNPRGLFGSSFYPQQPPPPPPNNEAPSSMIGSNIYSSSNLFITTPTTTTSTTNSGSVIPYLGPSNPNSNLNTASNDYNSNLSSNQTSSQPVIVTSNTAFGGVPQLSFTMDTPPASFASLAQKNNPNASVGIASANSATTSTASMLQEYGPTPTFIQPPSTHTSSTTGIDTSNAFGAISRPTDYNITSRPSTVANTLSAFVTSVTTSANTPYIPPTSSQVNHSISHTPTGSSSIPAYSPPPAKPKSPPLDKIPNINKSAGEVILESSKNKSSSSRIPKKANSSSSNDKYESMDLVTLQKEYRHLESELSLSHKKRADAERVLNNLTRSAQGKNIELDPFFRSKKEEQRKYSDRSADIKEDMHKVADRLHSKFGQRITPRNVNRNSAPRRAKMSTAAPSPRIDSSQSKDSKVRKLLLQLEDSKTWCETCDCHFNSLKEFCNHLHTRDHTRAMKSTVAPWRVTRDPIDKRKTYDLIKSICARVSNEIGQVFTTTDLDRAIHPHLEKVDGGKIKDRCVARETGKFAPDDMLFTMKGYNYLVPITGYYCKLCNRCLCDYIDVEQHLKGHEHGYKHIECTALNPDHEKKFRAKMNQSHKILYPEEHDDDTQAQSPAKKSKTKGDVEHDDNFRVPQYKKSTSHIVDEHEVVADKFTKRPERATKSTASPRSVSNHESIRPTGEGNSPRIKSKRSFDTGIVPLGDTRKPSALKRLRNETAFNIKKKNKSDVSTDAGCIEPSVSPDDVINVSDDEGLMDNLDSNNRSLYSGDPENPFPELELRILGNYRADILKDSRLASSCSVVLPVLNPEDYKDILNDEATLWARVHRMVAKRENDKDGLKENIREKRKAEAVYFDADGNLETIEFSEDGKEKRSNIIKKIKEEKPKLNKLGDNETREKTSPEEKDSTKKKEASPEGKEKKDKNKEIGFENIPDSDDSDTPRNGKTEINMAFLENFFCDN